MGRRLKAGALVAAVAFLAVVLVLPLIPMSVSGRTLARGYLVVDQSGSLLNPGGSQQLDSLAANITKNPEFIAAMHGQTYYYLGWGTDSGPGYADTVLMFEHVGEQLGVTCNGSLEKLPDDLLYVSLSSPLPGYLGTGNETSVSVGQPNMTITHAKPLNILHCTAALLAVDTSYKVQVSVSFLLAGYGAAYASYLGYLVKF